MKRNKSFIIQNDSQILKRGNGLTLVSDSYTISGQKTTIRELMALPACVYFMNTEDICEQANPVSAETCGWDSLQGGTVEKSYFSHEAVNSIVTSHQTVMSTHKLQIVEEEILRNDNASFQCLTLVQPWYLSNQEIAGVFGCSIVLGKQSIAPILERLFDLNLLSSALPYHTHLFDQIAFRGIYLSPQERKCLQFTIRGKTAKNIGKILGISFRTVEHYLDNIKVKFDVSTRAELIDKVMGML